MKRDARRKMPVSNLTLMLLIVPAVCSCWAEVSRESSQALEAKESLQQVVGASSLSDANSSERVLPEANAQDDAGNLIYQRVVTRARRAGQFNLMPPKLVQWSREPVQYYEGSTLVLSCSLSVAGGEQPQLKFSWFKNGKPLTTSQQQSPPRLSIEMLADYSFLRLADLRPNDSGSYTCQVSNSLGQEDRTTTQVLVSVKLKWLPVSSAHLPDLAESHQNRTLLNNNEATGHQFVRSRAGQTVSFECNVVGGSQPRPRVRWFRLLANTPPSSPSTTSFTRAHPMGHKKLEAISGLDETQIKLIMAQLDAGQADSGQVQRQELIANDGGQERMAFNESSLKWRLETTTSPGSGNAKNQQQQQQQQQHEIYSRLVLERVDPSASGLYECEVGPASAHEPAANQLVFNNQESSSISVRQIHSGDKLRRLFGLLVNGK